MRRTVRLVMIESLMGRKTEEENGKLTEDPKGRKRDGRLTGDPDDT